MVTNFRICVSKKTIKKEKILKKKKSSNKKIMEISWLKYTFHKQNKKQNFFLLTLDEKGMKSSFQQVSEKKCVRESEQGK